MVNRIMPRLDQAHHDSVHHDFVYFLRRLDCNPAGACGWALNEFIFHMLQ